MSACETGEIRIKCMDLFMSIFWLLTLSIQLYKMFTLAELAEEYMGSLYIISSNCVKIQLHQNKKLNKIIKKVKSLPTRKTPSSNGLNNEVFITY